jgi:hypothetical protein
VLSCHLCRSSLNIPKVLISSEQVAPASCYAATDATMRSEPLESCYAPCSGIRTSVTPAPFLNIVCRFRTTMTTAASAKSRLSQG